MSQPPAADASTSLQGAALHQELAQLRAENAALRARLSQVDAHTHSHEAADTASPQALPEALRWSDPAGHGLSTAQLQRYARHVALRGFGPAAQGALCASRVLVVGAGGLGCPAVLYLAAAGVGTLAIADGDVVEESNLHRQVLYTQARRCLLWATTRKRAARSALLFACELSELTLALLQQASVGTSKAACAAAAIAARNPGVAVRALPAVTAETAVLLLRDYDLVLDCTDTPASRYMLSDAAVCAGIPLVSGASIGMEGQVTVLCCSSPSAPPATAPCYRCLYPVPPTRGHCATCAEAGVLGPVPGVIGTLQAVEAIKVLCGIGAPLAGALMCYDALSGDAPFYTVQLPPRRQDCAACGTGQQVLRARSAAGGAIVPGLTGDLALPPQTVPLASTVPVSPAPSLTWPRLTVATYAAMRRDDGLSSHILIDLRPAHLFQAVCLQGATNVPFRAGDCPDDLIATVAALRARDAADSQKLVVLLCRAGNSSAAAADALVRAKVERVVDVAGGLSEWRTHIDPTFPL